MGAVPERAAVGHGARGLQRQRRRLELLQRTTRRARAPTAGARTASPASATTRSSSAWRWRCGTAPTRSSRSACSGSPTPRATTARTSRSTTSTSTRRRRTRIMRWLYKYPQRPFPYDDLVADQPRALAPRAGVRAARHRRLRRRPLLRRRRRVRQGGARGHAHARHGDQPRSAGRRRCTCCRRSGFATCGAASRDEPRPLLRRADAPPGIALVAATHRDLGDALARLRRRAARCSSPRTRRNRERLFGTAQPHALRQGRLSSPARRRRGGRR